MAKNSRNKKKNLIRTLFTLTLIFIASLLVHAAGTEYMMTRRLEKEINSSENLINTLENQEVSDGQEEKDTDNVKRYARGKYLVSKPNGEIYRLPAKNITDNSED